MVVRQGSSVVVAGSGCGSMCAHRLLSSLGERVDEPARDLLDTEAAIRSCAVILDTASKQLMANDDYTVVSVKK